MNNITREEYENAFSKFEKLYDSIAEPNEKITKEMLELIEILEEFEKQEDFKI